VAPSAELAAVLEARADMARRTARAVAPAVPSLTEAAGVDPLTFDPLAPAAARLHHTGASSLQYVPTALAMLAARAHAAAARAPTGLYVTCLDSPFLAAIPRPRAPLTAAVAAATAPAGAVAGGAAAGRVGSVVDFLRQRGFVQVLTVDSVSVTVERGPGCDCATSTSTTAVCMGACDRRRTSDVEAVWNYAVQVSDRLNRRLLAQQQQQQMMTMGSLASAPALVLPLCLYSRDPTALLSAPHTAFFPPSAPPPAVAALAALQGMAADAALPTAGPAADVDQGAALIAGDTCLAAALGAHSVLARSLRAAAATGDTPVSSAAAAASSAVLHLGALPLLGHLDPRFAGLPAPAGAPTLLPAPAPAVAAASGRRVITVDIGTVAVSVCADSLAVTVALASALAAELVPEQKEQEVAVVAAADTSAAAAAAAVAATATDAAASDTVSASVSAGAAAAAGTSVLSAAAAATIAAAAGHHGVSPAAVAAALGCTLPVFAPDDTEATASPRSRHSSRGGAFVCAECADASAAAAARASHLHPHLHAPTQPGSVTALTPAPSAPAPALSAAPSTAVGSGVGAAGADAEDALDVLAGVRAAGESHFAPVDAASTSAAAGAAAAVAAAGAAAYAYGNEYDGSEGGGDDGDDDGGLFGRGAPLQLKTFGASVYADAHPGGSGSDDDGADGSGDGGHRRGRAVAGTPSAFSAAAFAAGASSSPSPSPSRLPLLPRPQQPASPAFGSSAFATPLLGPNASGQVPALAGDRSSSSATRPLGAFGGVVIDEYHGDRRVGDHGGGAKATVVGVAPVPEPPRVAAHDYFGPSTAPQTSAAAGFGLGSSTHVHGHAPPPAPQLHAAPTSTAAAAAAAAAAPVPAGARREATTFNHRELPSSFVASLQTGVPAPLLAAAVLTDYLPAPAATGAAAAGAAAREWVHTALAPALASPSHRHPHAHAHGTAAVGWHLCPLPPGVPCPFAAGVPPPLVAADDADAATLSNACVGCGFGSDSSGDTVPTATSAGAALAQLRASWVRAAMGESSLRAAAAQSLGTDGGLLLTVAAASVTLHAGRDWRDSYLGAPPTGQAGALAAAAERSAGAGEDVTRHHYEQSRRSRRGSTSSSSSSAVPGVIVRADEAASDDFEFFYLEHEYGVSAGESDGSEVAVAVLASLAASAARADATYAAATAEARRHRQAFVLTPFDWTPDVFAARRGSDRVQTATTPTELEALHLTLSDSEAMALCAAAPAARRGHRDDTRRIRISLRGFALRQDTFPNPATAAAAAAASTAAVATAAAAATGAAVSADTGSAPLPLLAARPFSLLLQERAVPLANAAHNPAEARAAVAALVRTSHALGAAAATTGVGGADAAAGSSSSWVASRLALALAEVEIDDLVQASLVNKMLTRLPVATPDVGGRRGHRAGRQQRRGSKGKSSMHTLAQQQQQQQQSSGSGSGFGDAPQRQAAYAKAAAEAAAVSAAAFLSSGNPTLSVSSGGATGGAAAASGLRPVLVAEVSSVRFTAPSAGSRDELRVRAALAPLKANVDQDAVDVLLAVALGCAGYRPLPPDWDVLEFGADEDVDMPAAAAATAAAAAVAAKNAVLARRDAAFSPGSAVPAATTAFTGSTATAASTTDSASTGESGSGEVALVTFVQKLEVSALLINVDYVPKRVDYMSLQRGSAVELLHLFPLEDFHVALPPLECESATADDLRDRLLGVVLHTLPRQVANYVGAIQPVRALAEAAGGVTELVLVPLSHISRDGLARGLYKGVRTLGVRLTKAALTATVQALSVAAGAVDILGAAAGQDLLAKRMREERAERARRQRLGHAGGQVLGPLPPEARGRHMLAHQAHRGRVPRGLADGLEIGLSALTEALQRAAQNIVAIPARDYEEHGVGKAAVSVLRALPAAVLQPLAGTATALTKVAQGAVHSLDPVKRDVAQAKFKRAELRAEDAAHKQQLLRQQQQQQQQQRRPSGQGYAEEEPEEEDPEAPLTQAHTHHSSCHRHHHSADAPAAAPAATHPEFDDDYDDNDDEWEMGRRNAHADAPGRKRGPEEW
jgi:hypothetical protein